MNTSLTLYSIEAGLAELLTFSPEDSDEQLAVLDAIAEAGQQAVEKRDNVIRFLRHLDLQIANADAEIDRMKAFRDHYAAGKKRVERRVVSVIQQFAPEPKKGPKKLEGSIGILALRKNPDSVEITDLTAVPEEYLTYPPPPDPRPDKSAIKRAIQSGVDVPGADIVFGSNRLEVK